MEYAMSISIPIGEQIFCSWLFHVVKFNFRLIQVLFKLCQFDFSFKILNTYF